MTENEMEELGGNNISGPSLVAANLNARITVAGFMIFIVTSPG